MMRFILCTSNAFARDLGLFVLRVGIGLIFIKHGYPKLMGGETTWRWLGEQMATFGITFAPLFWGLAASCAEFFGGILLVLGLGTRFAAFCMACVMFVAVMMHYTNGDPWGTLSYPLSMLIVFICLMIASSGRYSVECFFLK